MSILGPFAINQSPSNSACNNELTWVANSRVKLPRFTASPKMYPHFLFASSSLCLLWFAEQLPLLFVYAVC